MATEKSTETSTSKKASPPKHGRDGKSPKTSRTSHCKKNDGGTLNPGPGKKCRKK